MRVYQAQVPRQCCPPGLLHRGSGKSHVLGAPRQRTEVIEFGKRVRKTRVANGERRDARPPGTRPVGTIIDVDTTVLAQ
jgi:hypothetical protein